MNNSDEIEERMRLGKVVKIEPMPEQVAPPQQSADILKSEMNREDRLKVAAKVVELSDHALSTKVNKDHITLKADGSVVVVVSNSDQVGFFIRSTEIRTKISNAGFKLEKGRLKSPKDEDKILIRNLGTEEMEANKELFREVIYESVRTIMDRRPKN